MFIDEMFEDLLVEKKVRMSTAMATVCDEKLADKADWNLATIKRMENGYQLFRKRHPEFPEHSFRTWVAVCAPELTKILGWAEVKREKNDYNEIQ